MVFEFSRDCSLNDAYLARVLGPGRDPLDHIRRLSLTVAEIDKKFEPFVDTSETAERFFNLIHDNYFLPELSILTGDLHSHRPVLDHLALKPSDDFDHIFSTLKETSIYLQHDIQVAVDFSDLRASRSKLGLGARQSVGPVKFMELFERAPRPGGQRAGLRFYLNADHLDIHLFLDYIAQGPEGISFVLGVGEEFLTALAAHKKYGLKHQRRQESSSFVGAQEIFARYVELVARGRKIEIIFEDRVRALQTGHNVHSNTLVGFHNQLVTPYEMMAAGQINLRSFVHDGGIDEGALTAVIFAAVHFLDNCLEANFYPDPVVMERTRRMRRIALSISGIADVMADLHGDGEVKKELRTLRYLNSFLQRQLIAASTRLGEKRGAAQQFYHDGDLHRTRHCQLLSQIEQPELCLISNSPAYLLRDDPLHDEWQKILTWHQLWQGGLSNLAVLPIPVSSPDPRLLETSLLQALDYGFLSFTVKPQAVGTLSLMRTA